MTTNLHISKSKQAANAERDGYYAHAMKLWGQVISEAHDNALLQQYATIRKNFCQSAIKNGWKRPEHRLVKTV